MKIHKTSQTLVLCAASCLSIQQSHAVALAHTVALQNATSTFSQATFNVGEATDNSLSLNGNGWATLGRSETAVWETAGTQGNVNGRIARAPSYNFRLFQDINNSSTQFLRNFRLSYTTDSRSLFADGLSTGGDVTANWIPILTYDSLTSDNGFTLSVNGTGDISTVKPATSVNASSENSHYFDLQASIATSGITGFRLEALPTPGWHTGDNNFVLRELQITSDTQTVPEPSSALLLGIGALGILRRRRK